MSSLKRLLLCSSLLLDLGSAQAQTYSAGPTNTPAFTPVVITASGTVTIPAGANWFRATCTGGGTGGGSGQAGDNTAVRQGGTGGSGGSRATDIIRVSDLTGGGTLFASIGAGGAGGAASSTTTGNVGGGGVATQLYDGSSAGASNGLLRCNGTSVGSAIAPASNTGLGDTYSNPGIAPLATGLVQSAPTNPNGEGPSGGGAGGGLTTASAEAAGGTSAFSFFKGGVGRAVAVSVGGTVSGGAGAVGADKGFYRGAGGAGGGGASSASTNGGAGGNGGCPGGAGGGGGASRTTSGAGGSGCRGEVVLEFWQ